MSDNEDFMMSDEEDPFEYEDSDEQMSFEEEQEELTGENNETQSTGKSNTNQYTSLENRYYSAKAIKEDDLDEAVEEFKTIIDEDIAQEHKVRNIIWRFKSTKQLMKIYYQQGSLAELLATYQGLFDLYSDMSDKTYYLSSMDKIIDRYTKSNNELFLAEFLDMSLQEENLKLYNDRLLIKLYLSKLNLLSANANASTDKQVDTIIRYVIEKCEQSTNNYIKQHNLLEVYSIQLRALLSSPEIGSRHVVKALRKTHSKCSQLEHSVILHPKILGVIKEAGGKLDMIERNHNKAIETLMESFKNYDEIGLVKDKLRILKSLIVLYLLNLKSEISILQSNEIKPYLTKEGSNENETILNLLTLLNLYEAGDIENFNRFFDNNLAATFEADKFLALFKTDILTAMKFKMLLNFFKSFRTVKIDYLCHVLSIKDKLELEELVFDMIRKELLTFDIRFNHVNGTIVIDKNSADRIVPEKLLPIQVVTNFDRREMSNRNTSAIQQFLGHHLKINNLTVSDVERWLLLVDSALPTTSEEHLTQKEEVQLEKSWSLKRHSVDQSTLDTIGRESSHIPPASFTKLQDNSFLNVNESLNITSVNDKLTDALVRNLRLSAADQQQKLESAKNRKKNKDISKSTADSLGEWASRLRQHQSTVFNDKNLIYVPRFEGLTRD